jgi:hypothetical protein
LPLTFIFYLEWLFVLFINVDIVSRRENQRGNHRQSRETGNIEKKPKEQSQTINRNWQYREKSKGAITDNPEKLAT